MSDTLPPETAACDPAFDAWVRSRLPDYMRGKPGDNLIAQLFVPGSINRLIFDLGVMFATEREIIAADLDELEPAHDTEPMPPGEG